MTAAAVAACALDLFEDCGRGGQLQVLIPLDVAHHSGMISPTVPI